MWKGASVSEEKKYQILAMQNLPCNISNVLSSFIKNLNILSFSFFQSITLKAEPQKKTETLQQRQKEAVISLQNGIAANLIWDLNLTTVAV